MSTRIATPFGERFRNWLKEKKFSGMEAAYRANLVCSVPYVNSWVRGVLPSEEKLSEFFAHFEGENLEEWLRLLDTSRAERAA